MTKQDLGGVFAGVRVLEFGLFAAGPYCGELLAHGGAEVIKVEPVTGDATRWNSTIVPGEGRQYIIKARGKRGAPINLGHPDGRAVAKRLALRSDVVLANMRPGGLERLGLGYEALSAENARIIVAELTAMGEAGPLGMHLGADFQAAAASGLALSTTDFSGAEPRLIDAYLCDFHAGTLLAFGIASALYQRAQSGRGQRVTTSLFQAGLSLQHATANVIDAVDGWKREFAAAQAERPRPPAEASRYRQEQTALLAAGLYETKDGRWLALGASRLAFERLLAVLELEDASAADPAWEMPDDPRAHFQALRAQIRALVREQEGAALRDRLQAAGVACALLSSLEEALLGEHAEANGFVQHFDHPKVGPITMSAPPLRFSGGRYEAGVRSPAFGEDLRAVLGEAGFGEEEIAALLASGAVAEEL